MTRYVDLRDDSLMLGRSDELYRLVHNLHKGRHTLLVGARGIGKTRLLNEARDILSGRAKWIDLAPPVVTAARGELGLKLDPQQYKMLVIQNPFPLSECLKGMLRRLHAGGDLLLPDNTAARGEWETVRKKFTGISSVGMQDMVIASLQQAEGTYLVFLDTLDRITPSHVNFIERLFMHAVVCSAVVCMREGFQYTKVWASFNRIELEPLSERQVMKLVDHCVNTYGMVVTDAGLHRRDILNSAAGNPFHIKNMLWHASRRGPLTATDIRELRQAPEGGYFNMGPLYIFSAGAFTIFKIFSFGTSDKEFYLYFSALGVLIYLAFRIFRAFFLFRPQKYE